MLTIGLMPSCLKILYYRFNGASIGKNVKIGLFSILDGKNIKIGNETKISMLCVVEGEIIRIGKRVKIGMIFIAQSREIYIGNDSIIGEQVLVGAYPTNKSRLIIGQRVSILPFCIINPSSEIFIGNNTLIGGRTCIFSHASAQSIFEGYPVVIHPVRIENNVWIGWNVTITVNASPIGRGAMIKAGAVVASSIPRYSIAGGVPARILKEDFFKNRKMESLDRLNVLRQIINDWLDNNSYKEMDVNFEECQEYFKFSCQIDGKRELFLLPRKADYIENDVDLYFSVFPINSKIKIELNSKSVIWFDLLTYTTSYSKDKLWEVWCEWFLRYGVKFKVEFD